MPKCSTQSFFRIFHLAVCFCIMLPLLLLPSSLHRMLFNTTDLIHGILYLVFFSASIVIYLVVSYVDPGYLTNDKPHLFSNRHDHSSDNELLNGPIDHCGSRHARLKPSSVIVTDEPIDSSRDKVGLSDEDVSNKVQLLPCWRDFSWITRWFCFPFPRIFLTKLGIPQEYPVPMLSIPVRFCKHCHIEQPLRCRHCPNCNRCVLKFDHHCPWISNCVGERNHSLFLVFLVLQDFVILWTLYLAKCSIMPNHLWSEWFRINGLFLAVLIILAFIGVPVTILLGFHVYLALANRTTWETVAHENITYLRHLEDRANPFNQGCARNCYFFCCSPFPFGWDLIYAENLEQKNAGSFLPIDPTGSLDEQSTVHLNGVGTVPIDTSTHMHFDSGLFTEQPVTKVATLIPV